MSVDIPEICATIPEISEIGDVIVIIGNGAKCKPCAELDKFIQAEEDLIDADIVKIDDDAFNECFPDAKLVGVPKILFIRAGKIVETYTGFGGGDSFKKKLRDVFG